MGAISKGTKQLKRGTDLFPPLAGKLLIGSGHLESIGRKPKAKSYDVRYIL